MEKEFLSLIPKRFLCPYCGKWHEWGSGGRLGFYNSSERQIYFVCPEALHLTNKIGYSIYCSDEHIHYTMRWPCLMYDHVAKDEFGGVLGCIKISDIVEDSDRPIVTFDECIILDKNVRSYDCKNCAFKRRCNYVKMGIELNKSDITINLGFEFDEAEYDKCLKAIHERKERELQQFATRR